jgi:hypothetical protein
VSRGCLFGGGTALVSVWRSNPRTRRFGLRAILAVPGGGLVGRASTRFSASTSRGQRPRASNSAARWQQAYYPSRQAARRICPITMWDRGPCSPMVDCQYNRQGMACGSEISMPLDHRVGWSPRLEGGLGCRPLPCVNVCLIPLVYVCGFGGTGRASLPPPHSEGVGQERGAGVWRRP